MIMNEMHRYKFSTKEKKHIWWENMWMNNGG